MIERRGRLDGSDDGNRRGSSALLPLVFAAPELAANRLADATSALLTQQFLRYLGETTEQVEEGRLTAALERFAEDALGADMVALISDGDERSQPTVLPLLDRAIHSRQAVVAVDDTPFRDDLGRGIPPHRNSVCVPVEVLNSPLHFLCVSRSNSPFDPAEVALLATAGKITGRLIESVRWREQRDRRNRSSERTDETVVGDTIVQLLRECRDIAFHDLPVLIESEIGCGKELLAESLHRYSRRAEGPCVIVRCGALPSLVLERELFGAGATARQAAALSKIEDADGGTLLLDQIDELPLSLQARLLEVLENGFATSDGQLANVRWLFTASANLEQLVQRKFFLPSLLQRIQGHRITVPPLRQRRSEIAALARHFLEEFYLNSGLPIPQPLLTTGALQLLTRYDWPGNVRELRNCLEVAQLIAGADSVDDTHLKKQIRVNPTQGSVIPQPEQVRPLRDLEAEQIELALAATGGNKKRAAELLGIHRNTLAQKLERMRDGNSNGGDANNGTR